MKIFQYRHFRHEYDYADDTCEEFMNKLGLEGWEIMQRDVNITSVPDGKLVLVLFAKRELQ